MATDARAPIVVGVDGSQPSYSALDWALTEAERRGAALRLVHAAGVAQDGDSQRAARRAIAAEITAKAEAYARAVAPDVDLVAVTVPDSPAGYLIAQSGRAAMVVVGHRGLGAFRGLLVGSVADQVATHAHSPVIVVRPHVDPAPDSPEDHAVGSVVVGLDGAGGSTPAVEFAFAEAALRGIGVTAVHAWRYPVSVNPSDMAFATLERPDLDAVENEMVTRALAPLKERYPQVPVRRLLIHGVHPTAALVAQSAGAELLVVGSRGGGGFTGLLLGSVSYGVIHHACCTVAVLHG